MSGSPPAGPPVPAPTTAGAEPAGLERIDRPALERILRRAAELQASDREIGEGLSGEEVLTLGDEVGIPRSYLRQAILEERSRPEAAAPRGLLDRLVGPAELSAVRVVRGEPAQLEPALIGWMDKHELLAVQRHQPGRIAWERLGGVQSAFRRTMATLESGRARFMLARADAVHAVITPLEPGYAHVALGATLREARGGVAAGAGVLLALGLGGSGVLFTLDALWAVAALPGPAGIALAWATARRYGPVAARVQLGLERALDHVEGAGLKPAAELSPSSSSSAQPAGLGLIELVAGEVRRVLARHPRPRPPDRWAPR